MNSTVNTNKKPGIKSYMISSKDLTNLMLEEEHCTVDKEICNIFNTINEKQFAEPTFDQNIKCVEHTICSNELLPVLKPAVNHSLFEFNSINEPLFKILNLNNSVDIQKQVRIIKKALKYNSSLPLLQKQTRVLNLQKHSGQKAGKCSTNKGENFETSALDKSTIKRTTMSAEIESHVEKDRENKMIKIFNNRLIKKYWRIWKLYVKQQKNIKAIMNEKKKRDEKIKKFVENLRQKNELMKEKNLKITSSTSGIKMAVSNNLEKNMSVRERLQRQRKEIEKHKEKLQAQVKTIQDLKLSQIKKDLKNSVQNSHKNVKELQTDNMSRAKKNFSKVIINRPKLLLDMEEKAKQRKERRKEVNERTKVKIDERVGLRKKVEDEKKILEDQERERNLKVIKDIITKNEEFKSKIELQRLKSKMLRRKAVEHHQKYLLKRYGFDPLRRLVEIRNILLNKAETFHCQKLKMRYFARWKSNVRNIIDCKENVAVQHYNMSLKWLCFQGWLKVHLNLKRIEQVADDYLYLRLQRQVFDAWKFYVWKKQNKERQRCDNAQKWHNKKLLEKCFRLWKKLPQIMHKEREDDIRKDALRSIVKSILPDYSPIKADDFYDLL